MAGEEKLKPTPENRESFLKRLETLPKETVQLIDFAYDIAKESHRPAKRDSGERYFEHPRQTVLILIDELKIYDPNMIIAELNHDTGEDTATFGNITKDYVKWEETARYRLSRLFNPQVAEYIIVLTKPKVDNINFFFKEQVHNFYIERLKNSSPENILLKMCDRLHNLRSLPGTTPEKQIKTCVETLNVYFSIFDQIKDKYPQHHAYLINQMQQEINKYPLPSPPRSNLLT